MALVIPPEMSAPTPDPDLLAARATAQYIEAMARDLRTLAMDAGLPFTAYLLSMVEADASSVGRRDAREKKGG